MSHANISIFVPHKGCPNQCSFCNQKSIASTSFVPNGEFVEKECADALENFKGDVSHAQIAFFGGSFTAIDRKLMVELLEAANRFVGVGRFDSIRISTRPDCIDEEILDILKRYNVRSIELGAQSMNDEALTLNRRGHTSEDVVRASNLIKQSGFELGLQMMVGLYGENKEEAFVTAKRIADLKPDTVRIYPTIVIKDTYLAELYTLGKYLPLTVDEAADICAKLLDFFETKSINVIRLGLHDSETLKTDMLAGPYHPAFRELCESRRILEKLKEKLFDMPKGTWRVFVAPSMVSKFVGHKKENIIQLHGLGYDIQVCADERITGSSFITEREN